MPELFLFDREFIDALPQAERATYQSLLEKNPIAAGRPFFLDCNGCPLPELEGFCNHLLDPRRGSPKTWSAYALQTLVFIRFLDRQGKSWLDATRGDINRYYQVRTTGAFQDGVAIKGQSWNVAKTAITHLYEYALDTGLIAKLPFNYRKSKGFFGGKVAVTSDIGTKTTAEPINFIGIRSYKSIWRPWLLRRRNAQRNLALSDLLITSGLRISEALSLQLCQIPDPDDKAYAERKSVSIRIVGKGKKPRMVRIPKRIIRAIDFYIQEGREKAALAIQNKYGEKQQLPTSVFLSETGTSLSVRSVEILFRKASVATHIRLTPHGCRHTYAVYQLEAMIKRMAINLRQLKQGGADAYRQILNDPLRQLQLLLGHSHISNTYIYLDFLEESEVLVDDSLADWTDWEHGRGI